MQALARELFSLKAAHTLDELNKRYRRLCKLYHPDLQAQGERDNYERFMQQINVTYNDSLRRFDIYTQKRLGPAPATRQESPGAGFGSGSVSVTVGSSPGPPYPSSTTSPRASTSTAGFSSEAVRQLASGLATLKKTRTFFSLRASDDPAERDLIVKGIEELQRVIERFGGREAQDALYYQAVALCNLRQYGLALRVFNQYGDRYPADKREGAFHFYRGLLAHRLGRYDEAADEYGMFLVGNPGGQYKHFLALVATFREAAQAGIVPASLPYA